MAAMTTYWLHCGSRLSASSKSSRASFVTQRRRRAAVITERDGPWTSTEYRVRNGVPSTAVVREQNALRWLNAPLDLLTIYPPDSGKVTDSRIISAEAQTNVAPETLPSVRAKIGDAKVWLHEQPNTAARTGMYLIKGDTVTLLDHHRRVTVTKPNTAGCSYALKARRLENGFPLAALLTDFTLRAKKNHETHNLHVRDSLDRDNRRDHSCNGELLRHVHGFWRWYHPRRR